MHIHLHDYTFFFLYVYGCCTSVFIPPFVSLVAIFPLEPLSSYHTVSYPQWISCCCNAFAMGNSCPSVMLSTGVYTFCIWFLHSSFYNIVHITCKWDNESPFTSYLFILFTRPYLILFLEFHFFPENLLLINE